MWKWPGSRKREKKSTEEKGRRITDADLGKFQRARVATAVAARSTGSATTPKSDAKSGVSAAKSNPDEDESKDIEFWKPILTEAQFKVKQSVNRGLVLQLKMNNLQNAFSIEADGTTKAMLQGQLSETLQKIEKNKEEVEKARKELAKLGRQARRASVPRGIINEILNPK